MRAEHDPLDEPAVLQVERIGQAELLLDLQDRLPGRVAPHVLRGQLIGRLPGQPRDQEEDGERDHADHDQQEDRADQPPDDEYDHGVRRCPAGDRCGRAPAPSPAFSARCGFGLAGQPVRPMTA
jgi:hypothetical protein